MKKISIIFLVFFLLFGSAYSQSRFVVGGRIGLSVAGGTESSPGFQIGPMGEYFFKTDNKNMALGAELNINTQTGSPVEWANYIKYFIIINNAEMKPYADGGFSLWFYSGGPSLALRFGGGINFLVAPNIYIPADIQIGPIFATGSSVFYFALTTGIRYELP